MIAEMTFTLYYSLLRRGLFESLGVWGEGKRKRAGDFRVVPRTLAVFRLLLFSLGEKVSSGFLDNKGLYGLLSLVGSHKASLWSMLFCICVLLGYPA